MFSHDTYISPFTWRYASQEMRHLWSEEHRRRLMRRVWVALAEAQSRAGLVTAEQLTDLRHHEANINIERALQIEQDVHHDVMAEIRTFAEQATVGGPILHWGATSADIIDNVDVLRQREALRLVSLRLGALLAELAERIQATAELVIMAHTHIQPAEPTTLGYRFAVYAQDLLEIYERASVLGENLRGKGLKGAVGTQASFQDTLRGTEMTPQEMESLAMESLGLPYYPIATQTYTRQQDLAVTQLLAGLAAAVHKFALDFRVLQSPPFGEWAESFSSKQVGSSAMPFKRNPINMENICSLARYVAALPSVMWDNASQAILERSLDDSANRRIVLANAFLATDELLRRTESVVRKMVIDTETIARNLELYGPFAATERILMALVAAGADRQEAHEWLRQNSLVAWAAVRQGQPNPLALLMAEDERIQSHLSAAQVETLMDVSTHTGTAVNRATDLAQAIRGTLARTGNARG